MTTSRIATVAFAPFRSGNAARRTVAAAVGQAAEAYGFVLVVGHGIPDATIRDAFDAGRAFFAQADDVKRRVLDRRADRGWQPIFDNERPDGKPSAQEGYTMGHPVPPSAPTLAELPFYAPTPWPTLPDFRERLEALYRAMFALGRELLEAMALHPDAPARFFEAALVDTYSHLRINHYPPHETVAHIAEEGVFAHRDESLLTLLLQDDNSGLQVMDRDGHWIAVEPDPAAVVVNVGKMLRHWTGGRYNAALHRVVNRSGRDRYSIPLFMHPSFRTVVDPRTLTGQDAIDPSYPPVVAGEEVMASFAATRRSWKDALPTPSAHASSDEAPTPAKPTLTRPGPLP